MVRVRYSFGSRHTGKLDNIAKQKKKFPDVAREVVDHSEIVLQVLDARFIGDMRNRELERYIREMGKKLIYVFNKADLIEVKKMDKKVPKYVRPYVFVSTKNGIGARELRERIKIEAKRIELTDDKKKVQVGIIGYPNVGKSSLINLISRRGAAKTSKQAGYTKGMQKVRFGDDIIILDTPGVIPKEDYSSDKDMVSKDAIFGARTYSDVKDPEDIVYMLYLKFSKKMLEYYKMKKDEGPEIFIEELGKAKGYLKKGGEIDEDRTSRLILRDLQEGDLIL